ncbi:ribbon-helix-helix domain-containing protein [Rhodopila sp.]|uniref:ribbon-helix-helix domain-containing protein n=1 Tax=Rhodopila sp. TaxID=2480087 RepID=UPI003D0A3030
MLNSAVQPTAWSTRLSGLIKRSFSLAGHRTSVALEDEFWTVLGQMAQARGQSLSTLVAAADVGRGPDRPLASALRVMALLECASKIPVPEPRPDSNPP